MSRTNKEARIQLEQQYGKGCMFKKAKIEDQIEAKKTIKTYKTFLRSTHYTSKKIRQLEKNMTFHHLRHRSDGGKATAENGAIVNELAHRYLHSLPRDEEEIINNMLRTYKATCRISTLAITEKGIEPVSKPITIDLGFDPELEECLCIPVYDNTEQDIIKRKKQKFNRARTKREMQAIIEEDLQIQQDEDELYR